MHAYHAGVEWRRGETEAFTDLRYRRRHRVSFDGGVEFAGSSSPHSVKVPLSDPTAVDPEEMFVASIASCHMLWFLAIAARRGFVVDRYRDEAEGTMARDERGRMAMTNVVLRPQVRYSGDRPPTPAQLREMHDEAHHECFIANSIRTEVRCEPAP